MPSTSTRRPSSPTAGSSRRTGRRATARPRVRADRHGRLRRATATSTSWSSTPRRRPRTSASGSRRSTAAPSPRRSTSCRTSGSATPGRGGPAPGPEPKIARGAGPARRRSALVTDDSEVDDARRSIPIPYRLGPRTLYAPRGGVPMFTDNETNMPRVFGPGHAQPHAVRQGRLPPPRDRRRGLHQPRRGSARRPRSITGSTRSRPAARSSSGYRLSDRADLADAARRGRRDRRPPPGRGRRVLRGPPARRRRPTTSGWSSARRSPGLLWTKQSYLFDVNVWLDGDNPDWPAAGVAARRSATSTGGTSTRCG